jgi:hypothetical protein
MPNAKRIKSQTLQKEKGKENQAIVETNANPPSAMDLPEGVNLILENETPLHSDSSEQNFISPMFNLFGQSKHRTPLRLRTFKPSSSHDKVHNQIH